MKPNELPLAPGCPNCGKGNYKQTNLAWLGIEIMLCRDCGYAAPVSKTDPRAAHATDNREANPL